MTMGGPGLAAPARGRHGTAAIDLDLLEHAVGPHRGARAPREAVKVDGEFRAQARADAHSPVPRSH